MVDEATILLAVETLQRAPPGATVVLFGLYARGDAAERSDLDFFVIEPVVDSPGAEMTRLTKALDAFTMPIDVPVSSRERYDYWCETPGTVFFRVAKEGWFFDADS